MAAGRPGSVVPQRYLDAIGSRDPFESQRDAPARVARLLEGLSEAELTRRPAPGKWSLRDVIGHLADGEVVVGARLRFIGAHDRPPLMGYDQDAFVENLGTENARTEDLLRTFAFARGANLELLARLPEKAYDRVGLHAERGEESIRTIVVMCAGHDLVHEEQILRIREQIGNPLRPGRTRPARRAPAAAGTRTRPATAPAAALRRTARRAPATKARRRNGR